MTKEQYIQIFLESHPDFFKGLEMKQIQDGAVYEEMFLPLEQYSEQELMIPIPENVTFGYYEGDMKELLPLIAEVDPGWPPFFGKGDRIYCAFVDKKVASFCLLENMGTYIMDGKEIKVAGPGCVGTLPRYRRHGIGLSMIQKATGILKDEGYDYSYIHYTGVANWYRKLGYQTEIKWNREGICD